MKTSTSTYWTNLGVLPSCSLQDANFLLEICDGVLLVPVHPTGTGDEECEWIHQQIIPGWNSNGQHNRRGMMVPAKRRTQFLWLVCSARPHSSCIRFFGQCGVLEFCSRPIT